MKCSDELISIIVNLNLVKFEEISAEKMRSKPDIYFYITRVLEVFPGFSFMCFLRNSSVRHDTEVS